MADSGAQLAHARAQKSELIGTVGEAREQARREAVNAYRAVRRHHPKARVAISEACFRAGVLLRAGGLVEEARVEFGLAVHAGRGTDFRARARLELGHLDRRERRSPDALGHYLGVIVDERACRRHRDAALYWTGRVHADAGRRGDARRAWERVAVDAEDPVDRVRAYDELGLLWIDEGDPEAAAGAWERCRRALVEVAQEETVTGARVRAAMERMRTLRALRKVASRRM